MGNGETTTSYLLRLGKSGRWEIRWTERDEGAGRSRSRSQSCGTADEREAERFKAAWLMHRAEYESAVRGVTVQDVIDRYVREHVEPNNASPTNMFSLRVVGRVLGAADVAQLNYGDMVAFTTARRAAGVKNGTIRRDLSAFRAALNWAADPRRRMIDADDIPAIDLPSDSPARRVHLNVGGAERMFRYASGVALNADHFKFRRVGAFICLALETAARESAIRGLTWDRVDLARGLIDFRDPKAAITKKRRVPVPISQKLLPVLLDLHARRGEDGTDGVHVLGHDGKVRQAFKRFVQKHMFPSDLNIHDLRRTWATLRAGWGVPLDQIAAILGDTLEVTAKHYAHYQPGYGRGAVDAHGPL